MYSYLISFFIRFVPFYKSINKKIFIYVFAGIILGLFIFFGFKFYESYLNLKMENNRLKIIINELKTENKIIKNELKGCLNKLDNVMENAHKLNFELLKNNFKKIDENKNLLKNEKGYFEY